MTRSGQFLVLVALVGLVACGSEKVAAPEEFPPVELIVSAPVPRASLPGGAGSSGSVVFVSAMPQAVPGAVQVRVRGEDGQSATASVQNGGFDPLVLPGSSGDVVTVTLTYGSGATSSEELAVRARRPPRVVRTSPGPHRTDVPLNAVIRVVFSSPVDLESARAAIRLRTASGDVVPGTVEASGIVAVDYVVTGGTLAPETTYRLDVTTGVRDLLGQALAEPASVEFRTGGTQPAPQPGGGTLELAITPTSIHLVPGETGYAEASITRSGSFTGGVALGSDDPPGVYVAGISGIDPGSTTTTLRVAVDPTAAPGTRTVEIRAYSDGPPAVTATTTLTVVVDAPSGSVSLAVDPTPLTVSVGAPAVATTIAVHRTGLFVGPVELKVTPTPTMTNDFAWPTGVTATVSPATATGTTSTLSISAVPGAVNGTYPLLIHATGPGVAEVFTTVWFTVADGAPGPALTFEPATLTVTAGGPSATSVLACTACTFRYGRLTLSLTGAPPGLTASIPGVLTTTATLTVQAGAAVAPGTYFVRTSGFNTRTPLDGAPRPLHATVRVVVLAAPT